MKWDFDLLFRCILFAGTLALFGLVLLVPHGLVLLWEAKPYNWTRANDE